MGVMWTEEMADKYIEEYKLKNLFLDLEEKFGGRYSHEMIKLTTVATHMRTGFFKLYPGLLRRIDENRAFAKEHGYIRFIFGGSRNVMPFMEQGSYDKRENGKMLSSLANILANADIQNFESSVINQAMVQLDKWLEGKRSYIFNMVHDSCDLVVHKEELKEVIPKVIEFFEQDRPEYKGIPLPIDISVSDLTTGDYYKHGKDVDNF
jgi:DNA polymerase I-like protein with 3'-5' exonuclease and polymerase domains